MKKNKKNNGIIATLVAVIILLVVTATVSIVYNFLGGFYYCRVISFDTVLGEEQTILVDGRGAFVSACNFSGSLVVGSDIKQVVNVQTEELDDPLYLRAKFYINGIDDGVGQMFGFANWVQATDGYLYFNQPIEAYSRVGICNTVRMNVQLELKSSTNYVAVFIIESNDIAWTYDPV